MKIRCLLSFIFLFPIILIAQTDTLDLDAAFQRLGMLKGGWFQATDQGDVLEEWTQESDILLSGRHYRIKIADGDTTAERTSHIKRAPDAVYYSTRIRTLNNNMPIDYKLVEHEDFADKQTFIFENIKYEYPRRIVYSIEANRNLIVRQEGERNGRPRVEENIYQREFSAAENEMYLRLGLGASGMHTSGFFFLDPDNQEPHYRWRPGWELGAQLAFKGRGNFMKFGLEAGLAGRYTHLDTSSFYQGRQGQADTLVYARKNVTYNQSFVYIAFTPELRLDKHDKVSIYVGPYASYQMLNRVKGKVLPDPKTKTVYNANSDFKKSDFGIIAGVNVRLNFFKRDLGGRLGIRGWYGLANRDNLYTNGCAQCTGKVTQRGITVSYAVNLLKS